MAYLPVPAWAQAAPNARELAKKPYVPPPPAAPPAPAPAPAASAASGAGAGGAAAPVKPASGTSAADGAHFVTHTYHTQLVRTDASGRERLEPLTRLVAGDIVQHTGEFRNNAPGSLANVSFGMGLPPGTRLIEGTLEPEFGKLQVAANGTRQVVWTFERMEIAATLTVKLRVQMLAPSAGAAAAIAAAAPSRRASQASRRAKAAPAASSN